MASDGYFRELVDACTSQGWRVEKTGKNHWRFIPPNKGEIVIAASTPSDMRARNNLRSRLRRSGLKEEKASR